MLRSKVFTILAIVVILLMGVAGGLLLAHNFRVVPTGVTPVRTIQESIRGPVPDAKKLSQTFVTIAKQVQPVVVSVSTERLIKHPGRSRPFSEGPLDDLFKGPFGRFFGMPDEVPDIPQQSLGSGVIIDGNAGYILTNYHVVSGATEINVRLVDDKKLDATLVGGDPKTDLAVIRTEGGDLPNAILGNSDAMEVGEWVIAVGNPFGLSHTVTAGIVSGRGRIINPDNYEDFIQTDAAINPGNSGGALVNLDGEVIGINTAIVSKTGYFQGAGFAIPINIARTVMTKLIKTGHVARGYIGIRMETLNAEAAEGLGVKKGVLIHQVEKHAPADRAGLRVGDVITEFQGQTVEESSKFRNAVAAMTPGTVVELKIWRDNVPHLVKLKLDELPASDTPRQASTQDDSHKPLGLSVQPLTREDARRLGYEDQDGVVVSAVERGSIAYRNDLRPDDLIQQINRKPVRSIRDYQRMLDTIKSGQVIMFFVRRGGDTTRIITLRMP